MQPISAGDAHVTGVRHRVRVRDLPATPPRPGPGRTIALAIAGLAAIAGLFVALAVLGRGHDVTATDLNIADGLRALAPGTAVTSAMRVLTHLGALDVALPLCLIAALALARAGDRRATVALIGAYAATQAIVTLVKVIVERARPDSAEALADAGGYAFPSGHSATAVAVYGALALVAARHLGARARAAAITAAVALAMLVGVTRVYLGVHYPSDVLAGWLLGGLVLAVVWRLAVSRR